MGGLLLRFSLFVIAAYFLLILYLIKKKKFLLRYGILWLASGLAMLVLVLFPGVLDTLTGIFGIELASNGLFVMCIFFIVMILVFLTVIVTDFSYRMKKLVQNAAIAEKRLRDLEENVMLLEKITEVKITEV